MQDPEGNEMTPEQERAWHCDQMFARRFRLEQEGKLTDEKLYQTFARIFHATPKGNELRDRLGVGKDEWGSFTDVDKALVAYSVTETLKLKQEAEGLRDQLIRKGERRRAKLHPDTGFIP